MKQILFVDDEPKILEALKRSLFSKRKEWEMTFAIGAEKALEILKEKRMDVIVSDMRMPKMDGATLLGIVKTQYPHIIRIVLSGYSELEATLRAVPVAHQFLHKPCNANILIEIVERTFNLQSLLSDEKLKTIVGKIDKLPTLPKIYNNLTQALSQSETSLKEISEIIESDMALSAKVLQLVNSVFFSLPHRISNMNNAVSYIGLNMIRNLALSIEVFRSFQYKNPSHIQYFETLQSHALLTAHLAKSMFENQQQSEDAFMAGMLHDVGKLIILSYLPEVFDQINIKDQNHSESSYEKEKEILGISHSELGAYLLGIWGLPYPIVEAVAHHHSFNQVPQNEFGILAAVHLSNLLVKKQDMAKSNDTYLSILKKFGCENKLSDWIKVRDELLTN